MRLTLPGLQAPITSPQTRMLLQSDGSTTVLLEALLGAPLRIRVDYHVHLPPQDLDARIRRALDLDLGLDLGLDGETGGEPLVLRKSRLVLPDGAEVSINRVLFRAGPTTWSGDQHDGVPLGRQLNAGNVLQRRALLSCGRDRWPEDLDRPCAYKEYVLHTGQDTPCYIHERFNPRLIPVD